MFIFDEHWIEITTVRNKNDRSIISKTLNPFFWVWSLFANINYTLKQTKTLLFLCKLSTNVPKAYSMHNDDCLVDTQCENTTTKHILYEMRISKSISSKVVCPTKICENSEFRKVVLEKSKRSWLNVKRSRRNILLFFFHWSNSKDLSHLTPKRDGH
jgi:hypothetical protein